MKILIIFAHPNPKSFCGALKDSFIDGVNPNKHSVEVIDLYQEKFNPVSLGDNEITPEIEKYQQLISNANCLVFIYPVWWF
jgi:NAD(P)H dehydrogenase (quinone)